MLAVVRYIYAFACLWGRSFAGRVGPLQIVDDEHHGMLSRQMTEQRPERVEQAGLVAGAVARQTQFRQQSKQGVGLGEQIPQPRLAALINEIPDYRCDGRQGKPFSADFDACAA
jgi:hypothetical protein